jgi:hydroxymethylbilane synthase
MTMRIGTRGSQLALWQASEVKRLLAAAGHDAELVIVKTTGDQRQDVSLASIGGKGLFIKELEDALASDRIDLAVHSLKDVPSLMPEEFVLAAFLERADPRDAWVHVDGRPLADLPDGSVIGTSAPRRRAQLAQLYPRLQVADIRGNVDTRIRKAREGRYAGLVLAAAGMTRLGRADEITSYFSIDEMLPAAGQGIVTVECLASNTRVREIARAINHEPSEVAAGNERGVLQRFGTRLDCHSAVAVHFGVRWPQPPLSADDSGGCGRRTPYVLRAFFHGLRAEGPDVDTVYDRLIAQGAEKLL